MRYAHRLMTALTLLTLLATSAVTAEPTPPRAGLTQPRTGTSQPFGSGTITRRSDGTSSQTRPFGAGAITTERTRDGRSVTGQLVAVSSDEKSRGIVGRSGQQR